MSGRAGDWSGIIRALRGQLESEQFLGARWLPMDQVDVAATPQTGQQPGRAVLQESSQPSRTAQSAQVSQAPAAGQHRGSDSEIMAQKQKRLKQIAATVAKCCNCTLHKDRHNVVPGEGNPDARIVFVGEAPGRTEDEQGRPFIGRAGQLLTKIIEAMGLQRQDVYICNILKCRPPGNRDPLPDEVAACNEYLFDQLDTIEPEIIVALGAHAARTLLNTTTAIGQLRGRFHEYQPGPMSEPIKLLATYHPAYLLRNYSPDTRGKVWQDMQRVLKELNLPIPKSKGKS